MFQSCIENDTLYKHIITQNCYSRISASGSFYLSTNQVTRNAVVAYNCSPNTYKTSPFENRYIIFLENNQVDSRTGNTNRITELTLVAAYIYILSNWNRLPGNFPLGMRLPGKPAPGTPLKCKSSRDRPYSSSYYHHLVTFARGGIRCCEYRKNRISFREDPQDLRSHRPDEIEQSYRTLFEVTIDTRAPVIRVNFFDK